MSQEKLSRGDLRLVGACVLISIVSLFFGVKYYFRAFPEASIEFRVTRETSVPVAAEFLSKLGLAPAGYRHAAIFGFADEQKTFLERELGVEESNRLLETTVRLWRWKHRWFRPLQKEELGVDVTTQGEVVGFRHLLAEDAPGADLAADDARKTAETFLTEVMRRPLASLEFVEGSLEKRPHRTDHAFTWKVGGSEVRGGDYRIGVDVSGSEVAGYREYLKVPDTWTRDYAKLRSKNEVTGQIDSAFLLLTILAMLVFLVLRIRRGDVRWKAASILGGMMFGLMGLSQFNNLPSDLYGYDTTTSFGGFILLLVLVAVVRSLGGALAIFLLAASGEPAYRERFPRFLSLTSLLSLRVFRTREFFVASLVGVTLTCFFFAYENAFYLIANSLGAWAPREVAYSDLLSTAFPWIFVLFFGFFPAISEEFISRMFSIPLFEKILRSTTLAVIVAAFIWGFGHAAYPNQPFWIRGLEVGLAGIVFGLVFLRFGIAAVVICHFSVDALYTAFILIRSPNLYYRISGSLSAGIFLVLFLVSALLYWRKGGFVPAERTNAAEGVAPEPPPRLAAVAAPAAVEIGYRPLGRSTAMWGALAGLALIAFSFLPVERFGEWVRFPGNRGDVRQAAAAFLHDQGFDVSTYRSAVEVIDRTDSTATAYLLRHGGLTAAARFGESRVPTPLWWVRFFVPGQKEEYGVSVDARTGSVIGFHRTLLDDTPGASIPGERALELAQTFIAAHGLDPAAGELKEQTQKDEKARRDHKLVWEFPESGAGDARARHEVIVQGDAVASWTREVKIPEDWRREREKTTALTVILAGLKFPLIAVLALLAILLLVARIRAGEIPWKFALVVGAVAGLTTVVRTALSFDRLWAEQYQTSIPAGAFLVGILVSLLLVAVLGSAAAAVVVGLAAALYPAATTMLRKTARALYAVDAGVAGLFALGLILAVPTAGRLIQAAIPSGRLIRGVSWPESVAVAFPSVFALAGVVASAVFQPALAAIAAGVVARYFPSTRARVLLVLAVMASFLPATARTVPEILVGALSLGLTVAAALVLVRYFLRDNALAWLWSAWFGFGCSSALQLIEEPTYRLHGVLLAVVVLGSALWLFLGAGSGTASGTERTSA